MPSPGFQQLIERVVTDEAFLARIEKEHEAALAEFDLTDDERQALLSGDQDKLAAFGVDERISKAYYRRPGL